MIPRLPFTEIFWALIILMIMAAYMYAMRNQPMDF